MTIVWITAMHWFYLQYVSYIQNYFSNCFPCRSDIMSTALNCKVKMRCNFNHKADEWYEIVSFVCILNLYQSRQWCDCEWHSNFEKNNQLLYHTQGRWYARQLSSFTSETSVKGHVMTMMFTLCNIKLSTSHVLIYQHHPTFVNLRE